MAKKIKASDPTQAEKNVGEILSKTDQFLDKHLRSLLIGIGAVILIVLGTISFRQWYSIPKEKEAQAAMFPGQMYYANQQWEIALNGNEIDYIGFEGIIDEFGGTSTANLAKAYAGLSHYQLGDYETALKYLKSYRGKEKLFAAQVAGAIGDCKVNLGQAKEAISDFTKAAEKANSPLFSPIYLNKAALAQESLGNYKEALALYNTIKTKYPESNEANSVDKYIERAKALIE